MTSKLLLEAGGGATISQWNMYYNPGVTNDIVSIYDVGTGQGYGAPAIYLGHPNGRDRYHAAGVAVRTSPDRTTSRPGSRPTS